MNYNYEDTFVEELVTRRNGILQLLIDAGIILVALFLVGLVFLFIPTLLPALLTIAVVGAYLGIRFQGVEFEYAFTNGDFDIDKIMAKRKRKSLVSIDYKAIRVMAPYTAEYESETKDYQVSAVIDASSHKNAAGRWFLIYEDNDGKYTFVVFQPSARMREAMQKYLRSRIKGMDA